MRIHNSDMSLHLLDFDEPVEATFEENFMYTGRAFCLCEHQCKRRLKICRESRIYVSLYINRSKGITRVIYRQSVILCICIIAYSSITTLPEKRSEVPNAGSLDLHRWLCTEGCKYDKGATFYIITYNCRFRFFLFNYRTIYDHIMVYIDIYAYSDTS